MRKKAGRECHPSGSSNASIAVLDLIGGIRNDLACVKIDLVTGKHHLAPEYSRHSLHASEKPIFNFFSHIASLWFGKQSLMSRIHHKRRREKMYARLSLSIMSEPLETVTVFMLQSESRDWGQIFQPYCHLLIVFQMMFRTAMIKP